MATEPELLKATIDDFCQAFDEVQVFDEVLDVLDLAHQVVEARRRQSVHKGRVTGLFLDSEGIDTGGLEASLQGKSEHRQVVAFGVDDLLAWLVPKLRKKQRVTGNDLLDLLGYAIIDSGRPLNFTEMLQYLDDHGFERPGANARNNIISMVVKAANAGQRFIRVGRGLYDLLPEERERLVVTRSR